MFVRHPASPRVRRSRRGLTTPLVAAVLLVAMLGLALIIDRMWLEAARLELITAAEAAALAGARTLASDERLRPDPDATILTGEAAEAAMRAAADNRVAGQPVVLQEGDVTFPGTSTEDDLDFQTQTSSDDASEQTLPEGVLVTAHRTRYRGNPVALFISNLTGQPYGDAVGQAEATISNRVDGVRPLEGSVVPAVPLAIWYADPAGERTDTWQVAIEQRRGRDDYGYDERTQSVTDRPDQIPELTLRTTRPDENPDTANVRLLDIGTNFESDALRRQLTTGWSPDDLAAWGGELRINSSPTAQDDDTLTLPGLPRLESSDRDALDELHGAARIALLYSSATAGDGAAPGDVQCKNFIAIRILDVSDLSDGSCRVTIQPAVIATRTALATAPTETSATESVATEMTAGRDERSTTESARQRDDRNPYIYRLQLTK